MTIYKLINNNQVICLDGENRECIVTGAGLGFKARVGQNVAEDKIEKIFRLEDPQTNSRFRQLIERIPPEYIEVSDEIITYIKYSLGWIRPLR